MQRMLWRVVEWHLKRHLTFEQLVPVLGDLAEELDARRRTATPVSTSLWLIAESLSVAAAYRARACRVRRGAPRTTMDTLAEDVRLALRRLRARPAPTLASIATLACAIGAAAATWSIVSAVLLHPIPVTDPEHLLVVGIRDDARGGAGRVSVAHSYTHLTPIQESGAFERVAAAGSWSILVSRDERAKPEPRDVSFVTHEYFGTLGLRVAHGRDFLASDDRRGAPPTAVLSDRFWRRELGANPAAIGATIRVSDTPVTVVGVAPARFRGLSLAAAPDLYLPLHAVRELGDPSINYFAEPIGPGVRSSPTAWLTILGRLDPGSTVSQATARLAAIARPDGRPTPPYLLADVNTAAIPESARAGMVEFTRLLATTVGLLLAIGCVTVGMLLLIRTEARRSELAVCRALGASRPALARGILIEGALLSLAGAILAVPVAWWIFSALQTFQLPGGVALGLLELSMDRRSWAAAAVGGVLATLVIAAIAAGLGLSVNVAEVLTAKSGSTPRVARRRTRAALVTAQVAVALVLIAGAALFARSLMAALTLNAGFDTSRIVTAPLNLVRHGYDQARGGVFFDELRDRLRASPAVDSLSMTQSQGGMGANGTLVIDGEPRQFPSMVAYTAVDDRYFSTMGLPILEGRDFSPDDAPTSPLVVIVSESFGRMLARGGNPVGHRITESSWTPPNPPAVATVIGVVPDVITNVQVAEPLVKYYSLAQNESRAPSRTVVIRTTGEPSAAIRETLATVRQLDALVSPAPMLTMEQRIGEQMGAQRFGIVVLGVLGAIALLLTLLGTYVVAETIASMRRREMSIRAAFGARRADLGALLLAETVRLVGVGIAAGLVLVWAGASSIRAFLFRVEPLDPLTLGAVSALILGLAVLVSLRPAVETARVDLAHVLREE